MTSNAFACDYNILTTNDSGLAPHPRQGIAVHTFEGRDLDAVAMARYQQRPEARGSYHLVIDVDGKTARENDDEYIPWAAMRTGNLMFFHVSLAGKASFTREQWLKRTKQLSKLAEVLAAYSFAYTLPVKKISGREVRHGMKGLCGHADISEAWHESDHTDPGPNFPWGVVTALTLEVLNKKDTDVSIEQRLDRIDKQIADIREQLTGARSNDYSGWPQGGGRTLYDLVAATAQQVNVPNATDTKG